MASRAFDVRRTARGVDPCREMRGYREAQMKDYLGRYAEQHGIFPSLAVIRDELSYCDEAGVYRVIVRLEQKGHLRRSGERGRGSRCIQLVINNK